MKKLIKWTGLYFGLAIFLLIVAFFADPYITVWSANKAIINLHEQLTSIPENEQLALKSGTISAQDTTAFKSITGTSSPYPFDFWSSSEDGVAPKTIEDYRRQEIIFPSAHHFSLVKRFLIHGLLKSGDYHDRMIDGTHYIYRDGEKFSIHQLDTTSIEVGAPGAAPAALPADAK